MNVGNNKFVKVVQVGDGETTISHIGAFMEMTEEYIDDQAKKAMNGVFGVVAQCGNTALLGKLLEMIISLSVGILRGLHNDEYVEAFLSAAIKDTTNRVEVETLPVQ